MDSRKRYAEKMVAKAERQGLFNIVDNVFVAAFSRRRSVFCRRTIVNDLAVFFDYDHDNSGDFDPCDVLLGRVNTFYDLVGNSHMVGNRSVDSIGVLGCVQIFR